MHTYVNYIAGLNAVYFLHLILHTKYKEINNTNKQETKNQNHW